MLGASGTCATCVELFYDLEIQTWVKTTDLQRAEEWSLDEGRKENRAKTQGVSLGENLPQILRDPRRGAWSLHERRRVSSGR